MANMALNNADEEVLRIKSNNYSSKMGASKNKFDQSGLGHATRKDAEDEKVPEKNMKKYVSTNDVKQRPSLTKSLSSSIKLNNAVHSVTEPPSSQTKKLPVAEPASFFKFFVVLVLHFCRKILLVKSTKLVWFYICVVTILSLIFDLFKVPPTYFSDKSNVWNVYFVKMGIAWTVAALVPFVFLTSYILCLGRMSLIYRHLYRILVFCAYWFVATYVMNNIEDVTGECITDVVNSNSKLLCKKVGGQWKAGFDISGHSFLLVYCILVITEEATVFGEWTMISEQVRKEDGKLKSRLNISDISMLKKMFLSYTPLVRCCVVMLASLQLIWNAMLLATVFYFHNMPDKFGGVLFAVFGWFLIYRVLYVNYRIIPGPLVMGKNPTFQHLKY